MSMVERLEVVQSARAFALAGLEARGIRYGVSPYWDTRRLVYEVKLDAALARWLTAALEEG